MRALVTRPKEDAEPVAEMLRNRNIVPVIAPMLTIVPRAGIVPDLKGVQAILLTSANGARALAAAVDLRDLPVLAVGDATARTARELGFSSVECGAGDVADLARLAGKRLDPKGGALYHAAATKVAGDLAGMLRERGFRVRREALYEARAAAALPKQAARELAAGRIDMALFFSPRTAAGFVTLIRKAGLERACERIVAYALSRAVAEALGGLAWEALRVAAKPDLEALLAVLDGDLERGERHATGGGLGKGS